MTSSTVHRRQARALDGALRAGVRRRRGRAPAASSSRRISFSRPGRRARAPGPQDLVAVRLRARPASSKRRISSRVGRAVAPGRRANAAAHSAACGRRPWSCLRSRLGGRLAAVAPAFAWPPGGLGAAGPARRLLAAPWLAPLPRAGLRPDRLAARSASSPPPVQVSVSGDVPLGRAGVDLAVLDVGAEAAGSSWHRLAVLRDAARARAAAPRRRAGPSPLGRLGQQLHRPVDADRQHVLVAPAGSRSCLPCWT